MKLLEHSTNQFNGVIIDATHLPADPDEFSQRLVHSMERWRGDGYQLIWLELPTQHARLIPEAIEAGFRFHHAGEHQLTLIFQLKPDALVPTYATHYIGAGGVVINDDQELLVVSELHRRDTSRPYYKLPGGALHPGEHLVDAVIREVFEETGVQARFERLVCFRHWHGYRFGKSDIYFICRLSPISREINIQQEEIEESLWMPVQEYLENDFVSVFNKQIVRTAISSPGVIPCMVDGYGDQNRYEFFMPSELAEE